MALTLPYSQNWSPHLQSSSGLPCCFAAICSHGSAIRSSVLRVSVVIAPSTVKDPQCTNSSVVAASLQSACTLNAITDANTGQVLIQNAMPGTVPTMGLGSLIGPGRWRFDANVSKAFKLSESK